MAKCGQCGKCVRRCHFDAFYHDGTKTLVDGKRRKTVQFDPLKCWGCGLCATTCPDEAISMVSLLHSLPYCVCVFRGESQYEYAPRNTHTHQRPS